MSEPALLVSVVVSAFAGAGAGFAAGLVPGLHMNNVAAALTSYSGGALAVFGSVGSIVGSEHTGLMVCCFVSSALVAHLFAESITSTYIGIPAEDVVSVLPAHRLARAGLGRIAVSSSADGSFAGVVISVVALIPLCAVMGDPVNLYSLLGNLMGFIIVGFSAVLLMSEAQSAKHVTEAVSLFLLSGILGSVILLTDFHASEVPDVPWIGEPYVQKSSLLLPLFAGLFGVPNLMMSLRSRSVFDTTLCGDDTRSHRATAADYVLSLVGGSVVGWLPGMTSGSSATLCAPRLAKASAKDEIESSTRFIWVYSFISASGAVFALGALFIILRARSGSMDAVLFFLGEDIVPGDLRQDALPLASLLLSMLLAACVSYLMLGLMDRKLSKMHSFFCSRKVACSSLLFVCALSVALTGTRGVLVLMTSALLGLLPLMVGVRRIQLMGCLLVPIAVGFFTRM